MYALLSVGHHATRVTNQVYILIEQIGYLPNEGSVSDSEPQWQYLCSCWLSEVTLGGDRDVPEAAPPPTLLSSPRGCQVLEGQQA